MLRQLPSEFIVSATNSVSIDLEGDPLMVGVPESANDAAVVYDYRWDGQAWNRVAKIANPRRGRARLWRGRSPERR